MKKRFLRGRRGLQLTSLVLGSLLCASTTSAEEQTASFTTQVSGTASDQEYIDAGVKQTDGTYRFTKDSKITYKNPSNATIGAVRPSEDLKIDASDHVLSILTNSNDRGNAAAIKNNDKSLDIKANTLRLLTNEKDDRNLDYAWGLLNKSGTITISGMTEIEAIGYSSARAVEAEAGTVTFEGLKTNVNDRGDDSMSLLAGASGQIFVNVKNGTAGNHTVNLIGNIGAMGEASRIDVAMTKQDSSLNGLTFGKGQINLQLQNGAAWNNKEYGYAPNKSYSGLGKDYNYDFTGSRLTSLKGGSDTAHAGVIFQQNSKDITIEDYSGHTRVFYEHDNGSPTTIKGGNLLINKAAAGSVITLTTDSAGLKPTSAKAKNRNETSAVLDALAKKLYYKAYATTERNLTGKVEIAEELTASSASKRLENITFDETTGQGGYSYTEAADLEQSSTAFTTRIRGTIADQEYVDAHVRLSDDTYLFSKDTSISYQNDAGDAGAVNPNADLNIDAENTVLTIKSGTKTAGAEEAAAIANDTGKAVDIKAKTLKLVVNDTTSAAPLNYAWGIRTGAGTTSISGMTEIVVGGAKESKAIEATGGKVTLEGLSATTNAAADDAATLFAQGDGHIQVNVAGANAGSGKVMLNGDIAAKDTASRVDLGILGKASYLKGLAYGEGTINLYLQKGGIWQNGKQGAGVPTAFTGSRVSRLTGGSDANQPGAIFQKDERPITIDEYNGHTKVFFEHEASTPTTIKGGGLVIKKAAAGSNITLITDSAGLDTTSTATFDKKNLISETLNALAGKLKYTGYATDERNLTGKVQIAEGLTMSSAMKRLGDITFDAATGQGSYAYTRFTAPPSEQMQTDFTTSITGEEIHDISYANAGIRKSDGSYVFTKNTTITSTATDPIDGGPWTGKIDAVISNATEGSTLNVDLKGKNLTIKTAHDTTGAGLAATSKGAKLNIKNAGAISIEAKNTGTQYAPGLFANGGGEIHIQNGGDNQESKVLTLRSSGEKASSIALIKTMNGVANAESKITIDGLVDILADGTFPGGKGASEAVSAVASRVDIGGGSIRATGDAWAAIRAYGEFVSDNVGTVNFNVTKDAAGIANGAGANRAILEGDIVTVGGMGSSGRVSVGLSTADSYWLGNYTDAEGYGVTPGVNGGVNLFMKNGAYWKGFATGPMKVLMEGANTKWIGFHMGDNLELTLRNGSIWYNAITPEQKDKEGKAAISKVNVFKGNQGFIDMTGTNRFFGKYNDPTYGYHGKETSLQEKGLGETGDLTINSFSGDTKVLYRHDAATPTTVYGGKLTIAKAAAGSAITLSTDSVGLNTESTKAADKNLVSATLNALANKLYYTAYTTGERNLSGKAEIAEGLTTSAASKRLENITFSKESGQGSYAYTPAVDPKPDTPKPDTPKPDTPKPDTPKPTPKIEYGDYETKLMSGVKSAMTASTMAWRAEANDLMKRMGDLRLSPQDAGVWARVYRGKATSNKNNANFRMNYSTIQVGYDKKVGNDWRVGIAGSYMSGSSSYAAGNGKNKEGNVGIYGTWSGKSGQYVDLIAKVGRLQNEYTVYNDFGHYVKGDYSMWGGSLSAEYGKRIAMKGGSFVEPQVELIYSHMQGKSYVGSTDYRGMSMYVHQKPFDSFIGRVGFGIGKETERSTCYARVSLYHEFAGDMHTDYSDGYTPKSTMQRGSDTWIGVQLGGTVKLGDRTNLYGNFEKTFGGDIQTAWRMDAGLRWNF